MSERNRPIAGYFGNPWGEFFVKSGDARSPTLPYDPFGGADLGDAAGPIGPRHRDVAALRIVIKRQQALEATT